MGQKNKAPAFQFYPKDFLTDEKVLLMTNEEIGVYISLLCIDWLNDGLHADSFNDYDPYLKLNGGSRLVRSCFDIHPDKEGYLTNNRLQKEREKQREWRRKSSEAGKKSALSKSYKSKVGSRLVATKAQPKGNSSSTSTSSSTSSNIGIYTPPPGKVLYGKFCYLTEAEYEAYLITHGKAFLNRAIEKLNAWIETDPTPKRVKNGQNASACFRSWVFNAIAEEQVKADNLHSKKTTTQKNMEVLQQVMKEENAKRTND